MRARFSLAIGFVLAGLLASSSLQADVSWTGPGWYVEETTMGFDYTLYSGPYADEATCNANKPADNDNYAYVCGYEESSGASK